MGFVLVVVYVLILFDGSSGKRCRGRMRAGWACNSRCNYATGKWESGSCGSSQESEHHYKPCSTISGKYCQFPFNYEGETFNTCISKNSTKPWCLAVSFFSNEAAMKETCSPDNESRCTKTSPTCDLFCDSSITGQTECSCSCSGGSNLGVEIPPEIGDCHDESGPCYKPSVCSSEDHDSFFSSVEFHEIDYSREDNTTSITASTPPITSGPENPPTEQQVEAPNIKLQTHLENLDLEMGKMNANINICFGRLDDWIEELMTERRMNYMLQDRVESLTVELANVKTNFDLKLFQMRKELQDLIETAEVPKDIKADDQDIDAGDSKTGDKKGLIFSSGPRSKN